MSHISRVFHFAIFPKMKRENREFAGNLVPRGFWEREPNTVQWKPWSSSANGKRYILWSRPCKKRTFLWLPHLEMFRSSFCVIFGQTYPPAWLQVVGMLTTFFAVYDRTTTLLETIWLLQCIQVTTCLETFVALFRMKMFGEISL